MKRASSPDAWRLAGMGLELGLLIGGCTYLGYLADQKFQTDPWFTLSGVLLAMGGGTYTIAKQAFIKHPKGSNDQNKP